MTTGSLVHADPAPSQPLHYRGHISGLDLLRGLAILLVLLNHAYHRESGDPPLHGLAALWIFFASAGYLGVHLFFVLSGFLITGILLDGKHQPGRARHFYLHRARRILPAYLLLLGLLRLTHVVSWRFVLAGVLFIVNMGRLLGARLSEYSYLWSLAVEEQFYLLWPWVIWFCRRKTVWRVILAGLLLPPCFRLVSSLNGQDSYFKTWVNLDYLVYGAATAYLLRSGGLHAANVQRTTRWLYAGSAAGILLSIVGRFVWADELWAEVLFNAVGRTPEMLLFVAMLLSALMAYQRAPRPAASRGARWAARAWQLPRRTLLFLGYISYGLYLVHMLVFKLYDRQVAGTWLGGYTGSFALLNLRALLCVSASVLLAWLSRSTLERWFLRRNRLAQGSARAATLAPLAAP